MQAKKFCGHPTKIEEIKKMKKPEQIAHYTNDPENSRVNRNYSRFSLMANYRLRTTSFNFTSLYKCKQVTSLLQISGKYRQNSTVPWCSYYENLLYLYIGKHLFESYCISPWRLLFSWAKFALKFFPGIPENNI